MGKQDNQGIAEALYYFAEKMAKKPHKHWYFGIDRGGRLTFYPEERGKYQDQAIKTTLEAIKKTIAKELEPIIDMRSQGIWYDLTDKKNDKMNETTLTGCSVVPTREVIKVWEKLTGKKHKAFAAPPVSNVGDSGAKNGHD